MQQPWVAGLQFLGALFAAALGFLAAIWSQSLKSQDTSKEIITRTVTNERAQWRSDMRNVAGELAEAAWRVVEKDPAASVYALERLRLLIKLRLNPNPDHPLDRSIMKATDEIARNARSGNLEATTAALATFEDDLQKLLKQEWDKSKQEARTGRISLSQK